MDLQAQIAARRAELAQLTKQAKDDDAKAEAVRLKFEREQRRAALDSISADLSDDDLKFVRVGDDLSLIKPPPPPLDIDGLRRRAINKLIQTEARLLWTPGENWRVIGSVVAGIFLIFFYGIGLIPLIYAMWKTDTLNRKYVDAVFEANPALKELEKR